MKKINVGIVGGRGRLGSEIVSLISNDACFDLAINFTRTPVTENDTKCMQVLFEKSDVVIDVSNPENLEELLKFAEESQTPLVMGTTGFSEAQVTKIHQIALKTKILYASNFSLGVCLMNYFAEVAARVLDESFDVELYEQHHRDKKDAPSGTALTLAAHVAKGRGFEFNKHQIHLDRSGPRKTGEFGFSVLRAGKIFGEHHLHFISDDEQFSLKHTAFNRKLFAMGAVKAAKWIAENSDQEMKLFSMRDVLLTSI